MGFSHVGMPEESEKESTNESCCTSCSNAVVGFFPKCFKMYSSCLSGSSVVAPILITVGVIVLSVIAAGISQGSLETDLNEIWIPKDSRIQGERDFNIDNYGGGSYLEMVVLTDKDKTRNTVNTATQLNAFAHVMRGYQDQNEVCEDETVTNSREPTFTATTSTGSQTFHLSDFCSQIQVPASLAPCTACTVATGTARDLAYLSSSGGLPIAWGYAALARCNWANRASTTVQGQPGVMLPTASPHAAYGVHPAWAMSGMSDWSLDATWGIDRYPCHTANILKAFREGDIGYPACMRLLEKDRGNFAAGGFTTAAAAGLVFGTADANFFFTAQTGCIDGSPAVGFDGMPAGTSVKDLWTTHLSHPLVGKAAIATQTATTWASLLTTYNSAFYVFGFRHKTSYAALAYGSTDDGAAAIASFLSTAIDNHEMTTMECLQTPFIYNGVARGTCPCIISETTLPLPEELMISTDRTVVNGATTRFGGFRSSTIISAIDATNHVTRLKAKGVETSEERGDLLEKWENTLFDYLNPFWDATDTNFAAGGQYAETNVDFFMTKLSLEDQLRETGEFKNSAMLILIGFGLLIVFAQAWYFSCHPKFKGASVVVFSGIICVALGVMGGYGSLGWMGFKYSVTSPVVALVGLGLGCDDLFVILNAYFACWCRGLKADEVLTESFMQAGPSVVITTLSNIVGFAIGAVMDIPAVRQFCIQMAITCFLTLLGMLVIVMPVLVIHANCVADSIEESDKKNLDTHNEGKSEHNLLGFTQLAVVNFYVPCLSNIAVKIAILVIWLACTGLAIWGCTEIDLGLSIADVSESGSYQYDFSKANEQFAGYPASVIARQSTWNSATIQQASMNQDIVLQTSPWISDTIKLWTTNWLGNKTSTSLIGFAYENNVTTDSSTPNLYTGEYLYTKGASGLSLFDQWMAVAGWQVSDSLVCHTTQTSGIPCQCTNSSEPDRRVIVASHLFTLKGIENTRDFVSSIENTMQLADDSNRDGNDAYVYGSTYLYWEQYIGIEARLYTLCAICVAGIVATTMLVEFSFLVALLMLLLLSSFAIEMVGCIVLLDLRLNAFSLVNVVVSIGFAVEYMVHLTHSFMVATGTREERVKEALTQIGATTFAGSLTAFLATFALASAVGLFNGMAVWPVILSLVGPDSSTAVPAEVPPPVADEMMSTNALAPKVDPIEVKVELKEVFQEQPDQQEQV